MSFAPAIVIPIYNHKDAIGGTVARLAVHGLPIFVVDDGSDQPTRTVLDALAETYRGQLTLLHLPVNGGKGAAVMAGMRAARDAGYTHALQIDADGQHDAADVPRFVDAARAEPDAMIVGEPVYDESVPKARLYGRYLTHVWVWIETLSFAIRDSMCGFRVYPLAATCALIDSVRLPTRMDFDIEIVVRLYWRGLMFRPVPTRVVYAQDGVSHFDVLWDNVRISRSHTRLVCGMLPRAPMLLARKLTRGSQRSDAANGATESTASSATRSAKTTEAPPQAWWRITERGSHLGIALLALSSRLLGRRITSLWLHPVVAYFLATGRAARRASHTYFARLAASAAPGEVTPSPGWGSAYRQMFAFANAGVDKFDAWAGRVDLGDAPFDDPSAYDALTASGKGALVIGAHLGNLEMSRALAVRNDFTKVTAIVYIEHARHFNRVLATADARFADHLVPVSDFGPETAVMMQQRIDAGELLVIVGDRTPANERGRTVRARFLGADALFAQGPFVLAHALRCPVYLFFCLKEAGTYRLYFEPFAGRIELPRAERQARLAYWAQRYASRLEHFCRKAPYQWYNFFDFWAPGAPSSASASASASAASAAQPARGMADGIAVDDTHRGLNGRT